MIFLVGRQVPHQLRDPLGLFEQVLAAVLPGVGDGLQDLIEARHAVSRPRRPVRAAEERLALGRQKNRHRPAAPPSHHLHRVHVNLIEVRPLLAVHLDTDEVFVQQPGNLGILEALVGHHVAPMAGRISDRQKDRLLLQSGQRQRLGPPRPPVYGVAGVLQQVGAQFASQLIGHASLYAPASTESAGGWWQMETEEKSSRSGTPCLTPWEGIVRPIVRHGVPDLSWLQPPPV